MGKKAIEKVELIKDQIQRNVTFVKRKKGLIKKAMELSILCGQELSLIIYDQKKSKFSVYRSTNSFNSSKIDYLQKALKQNDHYEEYTNSSYDELCALKISTMQSRVDTKGMKLPACHGGGTGEDEVDEICGGSDISQDDYKNIDLKQQIKAKLGISKKRSSETEYSPVKTKMQKVEELYDMIQAEETLQKMTALKNKINKIDNKVKVAQEDLNTTRNQKNTNNLKLYSNDLEIDNLISTNNTPGFRKYKPDTALQIEESFVSSSRIASSHSELDDEYDNKSIISQNIQLSLREASAEKEQLLKSIDVRHNMRASSLSTENTRLEKPSLFQASTNNNYEQYGQNFVQHNQPKFEGEAPRQQVNQVTNNHYIMVPINPINIGQQQSIQLTFGPSPSPQQSQIYNSQPQQEFFSQSTAAQPVQQTFQVMPMAPPEQQQQCGFYYPQNIQNCQMGNQGSNNSSCPQDIQLTPRGQGNCNEKTFETPLQNKHRQ